MTSDSLSPGTCCYHFGITCGILPVTVRTATFLAADVTRLLGTMVAWTSGDLSRRLSAISSLRTAERDSLTYCRYSGDNLVAACRESKASVIIVQDAPELKAAADTLETTLIAVKRPRLAFIYALKEFAPMRSAPPGTARSAIIDPGAQIHPLARIEEGVIIGPLCRVGAHTVIAAQTVLYSDVRIGENCIIDSGCVLGAQGFSFERDSDGYAVDFPHVGGVLVGNDVRIGTRCSVDRGTLEDTIIEDGVRVDNHSQISHNCSIGARSVLCGSVVLSGSVTIGHDAWISPNVVIRNQVSIGPHAVVGLGSVVMKDVGPDENVLGNPARLVPELKGIRSSGG